MKLLLVHPGASWSTADVEAGLRYGLEQHGVEVIRYRLDNRIDGAGRSLHVEWRRVKRTNPDVPRPTPNDVFYRASVPMIEKALRYRVDCVLIISAMYVHPDVVIMLKRAGLRVAVLFTESPYDIEKELPLAQLVDGCWTNERCVVADFRAVNPNVWYLPHGWHPERHFVRQSESTEVPAHDVVFVGSGFRERYDWFNAINWQGIHLGLYGQWQRTRLRKGLRDCLRGEQIDNQLAAALYRRAKIGLNLYRTSKGFGANAPKIPYAMSLNPRAYELAACGVFSVSDFREEVPEVFGSHVPTFTTPGEAEQVIRRWLADDSGRRQMAASLPACVAESSWLERSGRVIGNLHTLLAQPARSAA